ncbi:M20 family metallopeptidase [Mycobacterium shimoidei]|uniref:Peptidase M20 domain-containing protein 2 n=1 Tax=Mycobacterium shimoidei TaxID=29313 RepID=A0A1E3TKG2_MYCSH|nr:M20 family metallopeptidase [Mycobacterium shimoidei]MCV7257929.1 M20 family metallopeptidase [Mycobacterium shimoidei]ODR14128.1 peptidase M20 [Mycobacterium shimoidei]ORW83976.1 peptidase M20 [Mycobacterium shimoidei]SRX91830.1 putative amidohydrolase AmiB1 (aminohydrolase) [Mycobacterium tuberculosis H37Rv] [Mycobacterium shimoidei]
MPTATASDAVEDAVRRRGIDLIELSHAIHAEPELAFAEHRSCAKAQALVAQRGFEITVAAGGLDTAFRADFGGGPLVVAVCAEYDALPGIGHACGHNIIAASAVGTALALADVAEDLGLTVALIGTPAEEFGGGKILLLKAGVFDDVAVAVMMHPAQVDIAAARSLALSGIRVRYDGREAHASVAPYLGVNAADAATIAQVAVGLLRQQLVPGQQVHGIVTDGGQAANVVPARTELQYALRAPDRSLLRDLEARVGDCMLAGAVATGCDYSVEATEPTYDALKSDPWLTGAVRDEMVRLGRVPLDDELESASAVGSTDMGNVTQLLPGIHPMVAVDTDGASLHQPAFTAAAVSPSADRAVIDGAIMLARTVVQLAEAPRERDRVLAARELRAAS